MNAGTSPEGSDAVPGICSDTCYRSGEGAQFAVETEEGATDGVVLIDPILHNYRSQSNPRPDGMVEIPAWMMEAKEKDPLRASVPLEKPLSPSRVWES